MSPTARSRAFWRRPRVAVPMLVLAMALLLVPSAGAASPVIVQGTTDVRDSGLLEDVIEPGFQAAYPQYQLKYIAVGTGEAIANAKAGQGDALLVHAPSDEKPFVEEGYSLEPRGRAVFYSDYVIPGPLDDPAEVLTKAPHNAVLAYELIAKAGEEGQADFVSRGDGSGTNTQEKAIWKLTGVELNSEGEPGPKGTDEDAPWYHKAGAGQAETVLLTQQCPFGGGACYEMTDRGTYNRLVANGSVKSLRIVSQHNEASAPGGGNLLTNPFTAYAIDPAKLSGVKINVEGAEAFIDYLTSEGFQDRLASYPNTASPAFFADAHPRITASSVPGVDAGTDFSVSGRISSALPGAQPVSGVTVDLQEASSGGQYSTIASATTAADGSYSVRAKATKDGVLRIEMPTTGTAWPSLDVDPLISSGALTRTFVPAGQIGDRPPPSPGQAATSDGRGSDPPGADTDNGGIGAPAVALIVVAVLLAGGAFFAWRRRRPVD